MARSGGHRDGETRIPTGGRAIILSAATHGEASRSGGDEDGKKEVDEADVRGREDRAGENNLGEEGAIIGGETVWETQS